MDPTSQFFSKLRNLAVTLETESAKLQVAFENRNSDGEAPENAARAHHELRCDVRQLKEQVQDQLAQQRAREDEVNTFIKACGVMQQRVIDDIQKLKTHWEKYGYKTPQEIHIPTNTKDQESQAEDEAAHKKEKEVVGGKESVHEEVEVNHITGSPPDAVPQPCTNLLRTPQLSDFGLSEIQLKRAVAGWCAKMTPMPEMCLPIPSLDTPAPPMPITPKCALRLEEDELHTPQMHDFGISEHTMCLNNDFTMDLHRKNMEKSQRPSQDVATPPVIESLPTKVKLETPEPPAFYTPGFKISKTNGHSQQGDIYSESCGPPEKLTATPEVPAFQTPYVNQLVSAKKSLRQPQAGDENHTFEFPSSCDQVSGSKPNWEYNVPDHFGDMEDKLMPEMPNLESNLGSSLQIRNAKLQKSSPESEKMTNKPIVNHLELDGPTQEFSLGTPRFRRDFQEPSTPEMPDLSAVTQDICKLLSQAQQTKAAAAVKLPDFKKRKEENRLAMLTLVSESEFQSLPSYLRQMSLYSLNQAVHSINAFIDCHGQKTEFQTEELKRITNVGTKTPIYLLCLTELKRLQHERGTNNTSVYKLMSHN